MADNKRKEWENRVLFHLYEWYKWKCGVCGYEPKGRSDNPPSQRIERHYLISCETKGSQMHR